MSKFTTCWLTTNRACNIRCKWCYAKDTGFNNNDEISLPDAFKIVDLCKELEVKTIILIGGEPTIYSHILELIEYIKKNNIRIVIVTNGIILANKEILNKYISYGVDSFSVSLKAPDKESYRNLTGCDKFDEVLTAINNLSVANCNFGVSTVLTSDNIDTFLNGLVAAKAKGAKSFSLSFCYNFDMNENTKADHLKRNNPYMLAKKFTEIYPCVCSELEGVRFSLEQSLPLCVWDKDIIKTMDGNNHLRSICQLLKGNGILFDTDMSLIPCNAMYKLKYGKFGKDFVDAQSLFDYLDTPSVKAFFAKLRGVPSTDCLECEDCKNCGGGCVTNWTNYSFEELQKMKTY